MGLHGQVRAALLEEAQREVEADAVHLELVQPVDAHVPDELLDAAVVVVELLEEPAPRERPDVRRLGGVQIQPEIGKAVVRIDAGPHVVEDAVHDDMYVPGVQIVDERLQAIELSTGFDGSLT